MPKNIKLQPIYQKGTNKMIITFNGIKYDLVRADNFIKMAVCNLINIGKGKTQLDHVGSIRNFPLQVNTPQVYSDGSNLYAVTTVNSNFVNTVWNMFRI